VSDSRLTTSACNKTTVAKSKELKTESNMAESSKKGYGSKRAVLPMKMMMMIGVSDE
jgi:hypothetical protein